MHLFAVDTLIISYFDLPLFCNKLTLRYARLRVSDPGQVLIPQTGIVSIYIYYIIELSYILYNII